jgi:tol-pal system-associated acyl-CoA thioesterase
MDAEAPAPEFLLPLRVYIEDTDAGGIVYYVNYLKFMERARTEFMRSLGFGKASMFSDQLMFVVQDVAVQYLQPARLDDELLASVRLDKTGGASMTMHQRVLRGETVLVEADIKIACVDQHSLQPQRIPAPVLERLRKTVTVRDPSERP